MIRQDEISSYSVTPEPERYSESNLTAYEKTIFFMLFIALISIFTIAAWSGVLLLTGAIESGGPLGMLMRVLPFHLLL